MKLMNARFRPSLAALLFGLGLTMMSPTGSAASANEAAILSSPSFLEAHPDLRYRALALQALRKEDKRRIAKNFELAARYADKISQSILADLYWKGAYVQADRPLALAWSTLSAERGYRPFVAQRDQMSAQLSPEERTQAARELAKLEAEYGDAVAKPRMAAKLRDARKQQTGSRLGGGSTNSTRIQLAGPAGDTISVDSSEFYARQYWEPEAYWEWTDSVWAEPRSGHVILGDFEPVRDPDPGANPTPP
jgi:hypothetical protein